ncbi:MAG: malto-oligosyltrehalose trehalohydrolase [Anaerolineae bacterium]|nr:malto-oligosyltrehalose trehalohydrolase [Anaerolineae bacterium]
MRDVLGAIPLAEGGVQFTVWAPNAERLVLCLEGQTLPMHPDDQGYYRLIVPSAKVGDRYQYQINNGQPLPDPASHSQADTVHGWSVVVDSGFNWDNVTWYNLPLRDYVIYELHIGTFTPEGTFEAVIPNLDRLKALGITAIEIMPVAQFPGERNWGYDGVLPYAVQNSYGGPNGLKALVNACHQRGLAVILDVVYNHLGAEGNYLSQYGPYFTERYKSPWGTSLNFDGAHSDEVRRYFIENAIYWFAVYRIDALRLDATHALFDFSARTILEELAATVHQWADQHNRRVYLIAENDRSDVRLLRSQEAGGIGIDGQWFDDLHHCLHVLLTGETLGYYLDYGSPRYSTFEQLIKAIRDGFVYSGEYSPFHQRKHGTSSRSVLGHRFVVSLQNHDQVGNRMNGDRITHLVDFAAARVAAGVILLSPYTPMIFMGEEYGETAPFLYFVSFDDPDLIEAVRKGRAAEFASFQWQGETPDPQSEQTFLHSKLNHDLRQNAPHRDHEAFYQTLLALRKSHPALQNPDKNDLDVWGYEQERVLIVHRRNGADEALIIYNLHLEKPAEIVCPITHGSWRKQFDSEQWQPVESGIADQLPTDRIHIPPKAFAVYIKGEGRIDDFSQ